MRKWFWLPLLLVAPLAGACGDQRPAGEQERSPGGWQAQVLDAESGVDYAPLLVTDGNDAMVITVGDDGLITEFMVMVRPLRGATALAEAMGAQFDQILAEASAAESNTEQAVEGQ